MKLLFDANLSPRLVIALDERFPGSVHVEHLALSPEDDAIWEFARENDFAIVSKDSDFYRLSVTRGAPPKVIWLRVGNCSTHLIEAALRARFDEVLKFDADRVSSLLIVNRPQSGG